MGTRRTDYELWLTVALIVLSAVVFAALGLARYATYHNETFDLAFYVRMAWGYAHFSMWEPIVNANFLGLHLSPLMIPLGIFGSLIGRIPELLMITQAAAVSIAAWPLARVGQRRLGRGGALASAVAFLMYPNLGHVASFEFHPGTVAVFPFAYALDAFDRRDARAFLWGCIGVLCCREDLAIALAILGGFALRVPELKQVGQRILYGCTFYFAVFAVVLHPVFHPPYGSMEAHFGAWGHTTTEVIGSWIMHPLAVVKHLLSPSRLLYVPRIFAPLVFLPLLNPRWLLIALPVLGINLMSSFPRTTNLDSHYLTPAIPVFVFAAIHGAASLPRFRMYSKFALPIAALIGHVFFGGTPLSRDFDWTPFRSDSRTRSAQRIVRAIPGGASCQVPYALLPHVAGRMDVHRAPPPEHKTDYVVLDLWHREMYWGDESLLRVDEEPAARTWVARNDHAVIAIEPPYVLLARNRTPRNGLGAKVLLSHALQTSVRDRDKKQLTPCLSLESVYRDGECVAFEVLGHGNCPSDLAMRMGFEPRPVQTELLFQGYFSPAQLRAGDRAVSHHHLANLNHHDTIWVGLLRSSGARPEHGDPVTVWVPIDSRPTNAPSAPAYCHRPL